MPIVWTRFSVPNGEVKIQFLIENTMVTVFIQKCSDGITVIFEEINGNTVISNIVRLPYARAVHSHSTG